ncbi:MAG: hypothetical protein ACOYM7_11280 [Paludibacter sp.]
MISFCPASVFATSTCFGFMIEIDCGRTPIGAGLGDETTLFVTTGSGSVVTVGLI